MAEMAALIRPLLLSGDEKNRFTYSFFNGMVHKSIFAAENKYPMFNQLLSRSSVKSLIRVLAVVIMLMVVVSIMS